MMDSVKILHGEFCPRVCILAYIYGDQKGGWQVFIIMAEL